LNNGLLDKIEKSIKKLSPAEVKVANYILANPELTQTLTIYDLSENSGVSQATVTRFCRTIGVDNFRIFRLTLAKEINSPSDINDLNKINKDDSPYQLFQKVTLSNETALSSLNQTMSKKEFEKAVEIIKNSYRIAFFGVGGSAPIAHDAQNKFEKIGYSTTRTTDFHTMISSISNFTSKDAVVLFSTSGKTKDVLELASFAKELGIPIIALTSFITSPLTKVADIKLCFPNIEGDQRVGSTTSRILQLNILDALYLSIFHRISKKNIENYQRGRDRIFKYRR